MIFSLKIYTIFLFLDKLLVKQKKYWYKIIFPESYGLFSEFLN